MGLEGFWLEGFWLWQPSNQKPSNQKPIKYGRSGLFILGRNGDAKQR